MPPEDDIVVSDPKDDPDLKSDPQKDAVVSKDSKAFQELEAKLAKQEKVNVELAGEAKDYRLKLRDMKEAQKSADDEKLIDQKQYKTLFEQEKAGRIADGEKIKTQAINHELELTAVKMGIKDKDLISKLVDTSSIVYDDEKSKVYGAEEAIKLLKETKGYLFGDEQPPKNARVKTPKSDNSQKNVEHSEMANWTQEEIQEHFRAKRESQKKLPHAVARNA